MIDMINEIIAVWDENKIRSDELKNYFNLINIPFINISIKYNTVTEYPKEAEIKETSAVFLSFDSDEGSIAKAVNISTFIKLTNKACLIVLICDKDINFNVFYRPSISPCGVICRPFTLQFLESIFEEVIAELQRLKQEPQNRQNKNIKENDTFNVKIGGNHYSFFYRDILFFEAQTKKVAVKTFGQEVCFYDAIETIAEHLPPYFIRCHRSYIININHIKSTHLGDNMICLKDNSRIPISRSYKGDVRQVVKENSGGSQIALHV